MTIRRDSFGIPHVSGGDVLEMAFEQGRAMAIDRRWQLEIERLRGEGRTAALVGAGGVEWDTFARRARIAETAQQAFAAADPATQEFVEAYVEGVRAALPTAPCAELDLLGPAPGEWQPWTPMAIFLVQHVLFGAIGHDVWRRRVRAALGESAALLLGHDPNAGGSNAVVIGGSLTASGFPIVAGDPHRLFEAPNVYVQVRLSCPELDVVGLSFPGVPGVQHFGHTGAVAWAVTNAMADQHALVEVPVASCVSTREPLVVRDADPVAITVLSSDVGPALLVDGDTALCLSGPSYAAGSMLDAVLPLLRARSVEDVDAALERWVEPVNNVLVADRTGRTLHRVAGRLPVELPRIEGRPDGVLVTANDRTTPEFDALGDRFAPPHRASRLRELLAGSSEWTPTSVAAVLGDVRLDHDGLLSRIATLDALPERARANRDALLAWDRRLDATSTDAALYVRVRDRLVLALADAEPLAALADPAAYGERWVPWLWLPGRIASTLGGWLAADEPLGIDVASLLAAALDVEKVDSSWGERHRFTPVHALTDLGVEHLFHPLVAGRGLSGDTDCVAATGSIPGLPDSVMGPVARYVWDLGDRGASRWAVPLGTAGDHRDPHHSDQFDAWSSCHLIPLEEPVMTPAAGIAFRPVVPATDAPLIHDWVTQPRARYWGMLERDLEEVEAIYTYIDEQPHLTAWLASVDETPVAIVQTYDPFVDEIGEYYDRRPGDVGLHLFLADDPARAGHTAALLTAAMRSLLTDPGTRRIVLEPDIGNESSIELLTRLGATLGPIVELPGKTAQFAFIDETALPDRAQSCTGQRLSRTPALTTWGTPA